MFDLFLLVLSSAAIAVRIEKTGVLPGLWCGLYGLSAVVTVAGVAPHTVGVTTYINSGLLLLAAVTCAMDRFPPIIWIVLLILHTSVSIMHMVSDSRFTDVYVSLSLKAAAVSVALYRRHYATDAPSKQDV